MRAKKAVVDELKDRLTAEWNGKKDSSEGSSLSA